MSNVEFLDEQQSMIQDNLIIKENNIEIYKGSGHTNTQLFNHPRYDSDNIEMVNQKPIIGSLIIKDKNTGEILLNANNAIHPENFSLTIAYALMGRREGTIYGMQFGNGATNVSGINTVTYFTPNVNTPNASLYNPTYFKVLADTSENLDNLKNSITITHESGRRYTDLVMLCTLDLGEPSGQDAWDDNQSMNGDFVFDEIGIRAFPSSLSESATSGLLLSHIIFHPILKSLNRVIEVIYTFRINIC